MSTDSEGSLLAATLANPEPLADTDLVEATIVAHSAMIAMQDEYLQLGREISRSDESYKARKNPREPWDNTRYRTWNDRRIFDILQKFANGSATTSTHRSRSPNVVCNAATLQEPSPVHLPPKMTNRLSPPNKGATKDPLAIDMNIEHITIATPKRERKPRTFLYGSMGTCNRSPTLPQIKNRKRTATDFNAGEQSIKSDRAVKRRVFDEEGDHSEENGMDIVSDIVTPNLTRGEAMRRVWAKRQVAGTNGRYGGAPIDKVAKEKHEVKARMATGKGDV